MTKEQEDSFLNEFPNLPNNERVTPAEQRLVAQYGKIFGPYAYSLRNDYHPEGGTAR